MSREGSTAGELSERLDHLSETLDQVCGQLERIEERQKQLLRGGSELPSPARKYTYQEAGVRLTTGRDPMDVPKEKWGECLSARSVMKLCSDGDCPLRALRYGGRRTVRITEAEIRNYERSVERGFVSGYQVKSPRKHRG